MNNQDLIRLGVPQGDALTLICEHMLRMFAGGLDHEQVEEDIFNVGGVLATDNAVIP